MTDKEIKAIDKEIKESLPGLAAIKPTVEKAGATEAFLFYHDGDFMMRVEVVGGTIFGYGTYARDGEAHRDVSKQMQQMQQLNANY